MSKSRKKLFDDNKDYIYSLQSILIQMIYSRNSNREAYENFTKLLVSDRRESVIEYMMNAIISCFISDDHRSVELVFNDPNSVSSFFVNVSREYPWIFEHQLSDPITSKRYRMVLILKSLFSLKIELPGINIARELMTVNCQNIWNEFLKRFTDVEPEIRIACVQTAEVLLKTQIDEQIVNNLQGNLTKRFQDFEQQIRADTCSTVDNTSGYKLQNILSDVLIRHFIARTGDSVLDVRKRVLISVSNVYHAICERYPQTLHLLTFVFKLPSGCLLRYCITDDSEEKSMIEMIFACNFMDMNANNSDKVNNLLSLVCHCTSSAVASISRILHNQKRLCTLMLQFMELFDSSEKKDSQLSRTKVVKQVCSEFGTIDDIQSVVIDFYRLFAQNRDKISEFKIILSRKINSCEEALKSIEEIFNLNEEVFCGENHSEFKGQLISRCGLTMIDIEFIITVLKRVNQLRIEYSTRLASLIVLLSNLYSDYFKEESVTAELLNLGLPIIVILSNDSILDHLQCAQQIKLNLKRIVNENLKK